VAADRKRDEDGVSLTATTHRSIAFRINRSDPTGIPLLMQIDRWDVRSDGPLTEAALQEKLKRLGYDPLPRSLPSGVIVSARTHHRPRADAVIAGLLKVTIDGESAILTAGDIVFIPSGAMRRVDPVGNAPVLCIEAVRLA
jgi:mannose-6-phosphate isomerase-like protein (cupin superfamily)